MSRIQEALPRPKRQAHVYFHHMVGTAGNSLADTLARSSPGYGIVRVTGGERLGDPAQLQSPLPRCLFYGHNIFGLVEKANLDERYLTLLRHPYERLITDYFWQQTHNLGRSGRQAYDSFLTFVDACEHLEFYIYQCGPLRYDNAQHFVLRDHQCVSVEEAERQARANLEGRFWLVAIAELFEASLLLAATALGIDLLPAWRLWRHRTTPYRPAYLELPRATRAVIERKTARDTELYEHQRGRFEAQVAQHVDPELLEAYFALNHPIATQRWEHWLQSLGRLLDPQRFRPAALRLPAAP